MHFLILLGLGAELDELSCDERGLSLRRRGGLDEALRAASLEAEESADGVINLCSSNTSGRGHLFI
jgi:hypothetical protein